ncbi:MAG: HEAT repeat domain-containing protein, partial [Candidatus Micrarchaeia archaeon]
MVENANKPNENRRDQEVAEAKRSHQPKEIFNNISPQMSFIDDTQKLRHIQDKLKKITDPDARVLLIRSIGNIGNPKGVMLLHEFLEDGSDRIVTEAVTALAAIGDPESLKSILSITKTSRFQSSPIIRASVARALGCFNDSSVSEELKKMLKDSDDEVRREASTSLGCIGDTSVLTSLFEAVMDKSPYVRAECIRSIDNILKRKHVNAKHIEMIVDRTRKLEDAEKNPFVRNRFEEFINDMERIMNLSKLESSMPRPADEATLDKAARMVEQLAAERDEEKFRADKLARQLELEQGKRRELEMQDKKLKEQFAEKLKKMAELAARLKELEDKIAESEQELNEEKEQSGRIQNAEEIERDKPKDSIKDDEGGVENRGRETEVKLSPAGVVDRMVGMLDAIDELKKRRRANVFKTVVITSTAIGALVTGFFFGGTVAKRNQARQMAEMKVQLERLISERDRAKEELENIRREKENLKQLQIKISEEETDKKKAELEKKSKDVQSKLTQLEAAKEEQKYLDGIRDMVKQMEKMRSKDIMEGMIAVFGMDDGHVDLFKKCVEKFDESTAKKYGIKTAFLRKQAFLKAAEKD